MGAQHMMRGTIMAPGEITLREAGGSTSLIPEAGVHPTSTEPENTGALGVSFILSSAVLVPLNLTESHQHSSLSHINS